MSALLAHAVTVAGFVGKIIALAPSVELLVLLAISADTCYMSNLLSTMNPQLNVK